MTRKYQWSPDLRIRERSTAPSQDATKRASGHPAAGWVRPNGDGAPTATSSS